MSLIWTADDQIRDDDQERQEYLRRRAEDISELREVSEQPAEGQPWRAELRYRAENLTEQPEPAEPDFLPLKFYQDDDFDVDLI